MNFLKRFSNWLKRFFFKVEVAPELEPPPEPDLSPEEGIRTLLSDMTPSNVVFNCFGGVNPIMVERCWNSSSVVQLWDHVIKLGHWNSTNMRWAYVEYSYNEFPEASELRKFLIGTYYTESRQKLTRECLRDFMREKK